MHDPMVVAFEIRRPWPERDCAPRRPGAPRWEVRWSAFWTVAGHRLYWPGMVTVWHVEPDGRDSGEVCPHYRNERYQNGRKATRRLHGWRWHVWHWRIQVEPLQNLRRRLLTRCEWCAGRHSRRDAVNVSHSWHAPPAPWWRGEPGLFHMGCSSVWIAHRVCTCDVPVLSRRDYGECSVCGRVRSYGQTAAMRAGALVLRECPLGERPTAALLDRATSAREMA